MASKQTSDSKNHNPEGHNQYTDNSKSSSLSGGQHAGSGSGSSHSGSSGQGSHSGGTQGGTHEQHVKAGQQSHKNS